MVKAHREWTVLPHGPVETIGNDVFRIEGVVPGMPIRRHMIVVRDHARRLLIHNAVCLRDDVRERFESLGTPTWLVVPNGYHRLDAYAFKARYPELRVYCPAGARARVEQVLPVDAAYDGFPTHDSIRAHAIDGVVGEGVLEIRASDGVTLIFNDLVFNHPHFPGVLGRLYELFRQSGRPIVPFVPRLSFVKDRRACRAHLERLAATDGLARVIPGHVAPIATDATGVLRRLAAQL